jgi:tetratricopeptide (TPR) repeat protein
MIKAYLDMLEVSPDNYTSIKSRLQYIITSSANDEIIPVLKKELIKRIQKKPSATQYTNLMVWLLLQQHKYAEALHYAIILDKREKSPEKILEIGRTLMNTGKYDLAIKAFNHIMTKYDKSSLNYIFAKTYYLQTLFKKLTENRKTTGKELSDLKKDFETTLETYSYNNSTFPAIKNYALLLGKYLHKPDSAGSFLETIINKYSAYFDKNKLLELKLLLGDMYLISGDPWTATIIYSRIERQTVSPELRDRAKLKKALMAFYKGDIDWAKALLDVLKGSTSKPVANDAFKLSEFISNNTSFDSTIEPLQMYGRAKLLEFSGKDSLAILTLDSIIAKFPEHSIIDDANLEKGVLYEKMGNYSKAIEAYKYVADYYPFDILADNALYHLAILYDKKLSDSEKALKYYKKIMIDYPESIFAEEARQRFNEIKHSIN